MSINDSHTCYRHPSLTSYPKHYKLILLFDFVTITIYKVTISGYFDLGMVCHIIMDFIGNLIDGYEWSGLYNSDKA